MSDRGDPLAELLEITRRLQVECPWRAEQTHDSLLPYLHEETAELAEAIVRGTDDEVRDELGDVLLQVVLHAAIAEQDGRFTLDDVAAGLVAKLRRRNPHVFDPASLGRRPGDPPLTASEVTELYQQAKSREGGRAPTR